MANTREDWISRTHMQASPHPGRSEIRRVLVLAEGPLASLVESALGGSYATWSALTPRVALGHAERWSPELCVIDLDLADLRVLTRLTLSRGSQPVPVIGITARSDVRTTVVALEAGADDVIRLPLQVAELLARVRALIRRSYGERRSRRIEVGDLSIGVVGREARLAGESVHLTPRESALLLLLATNVGRIVSRNEVLDAVWGQDQMPSVNTLERHVSGLRTKLGDSPARPKYIETVRGRGYRLVAGGLISPMPPVGGDRSTSAAVAVPQGRTP